MLESNQMAQFYPFRALQNRNMDYNVVGRHGTGNIQEHPCTQSTILTQAVRFVFILQYSSHFGDHKIKKISRKNRQER
jgi:hypothetical protein